jgi:uncharacterized membrane protein YeiH
VQAVVQLILDLAGIFVFGLSGSLVGIRKQLDVVGVLVMALVTGLGGGIIRDLLIGANPPAAFSDWRYLLVPLLAGAIAIRFHPRLVRIERSIDVFDALGLGLFCVTGSVKAMMFGFGPVPGALLGLLTGIGGGVLRDLLAGRTPVVLREDVYALPALAGSIVVVVTWELDWYQHWTPFFAAAVCIILRLLAIRYRWQPPRAIDLSR